MKIGILVDSGALTDVTELKGTSIDLIPLHVNLEDGTDFLDTVDNIFNNDVYNRLNNGEAIKTSMASPGELIEKYDAMLKSYDHILHLTITPNLSSMRESAKMVVRTEGYEGKVTVVEHNMAANAIKYLAFWLNDMISSGVTDPAEFQKAADDFYINAHSYIIPGDYKKLASGGRGRKVLLAFLSKLKMKILIEWAKEPKKLAMGGNFKGLFDKLKKQLTPDHLIIFAHTHKTTERTIALTKSYLEENKIEYITEVIPTIYPCHSGTETIGFITVNKKFLAKK
jgi:DegV family protein with EDD domain